MSRKLGKLAPRHDPRSLKLARYLDLAKLPALKDAVTNSTIYTRLEKPWGMMLNDQLGDCTCAAMGHVVMLVSEASGKLVVPTDAEVEKMYEVIGGYKPGQPSTDNGAVELDALKFMRKTGLSGVRIHAFADVSPADLVHVKFSIQLFGICYIGVQLTQSDEDAFDAGKPWTDTGDTNFIGGHAIPLVDFDEEGPTCVTWGQLQPMSWDWFQKRCDEAHAPLFIEGFAPSGLKFSALDADLTVVTA